MYIVSAVMLCINVVMNNVMLRTCVSLCLFPVNTAYTHDHYCKAMHSCISTFVMHKAYTHGDRCKALCLCIFVCVEEKAHAHGVWYGVMHVYELVCVCVCTRRVRTVMASRQCMMNS
jgi:hypothetical protein